MWFVFFVVFSHSIFFVIIYIISSYFFFFLFLSLHIYRMLSLIRSSNFIVAYIIPIFFCRSASYFILLLLFCRINSSRTSWNVCGHFLVLYHHNIMIQDDDGQKAFHPTYTPKLNSLMLLFTQQFILIKFHFYLLTTKSVFTSIISHKMNLSK